MMPVASPTKSCKSCSFAVEAEDLQKDFQSNREGGSLNPQGASPVNPVGLARSGRAQASESDDYSAVSSGYISTTASLKSWIAVS